jgi:phosphoserine phosphatase
MPTLPLTPQLPPSAPVEWLPFDLIFFDCDSTLSTMEGIDELARWLGREAEVAALTAQAMNGEVPLEAVYSRRLDLLQPTREQLRRLGHLYRETLVPGAAEVLAALMAAGRKVFIVSGGLAEAVQDFGAALGVPADHIVAVEVEYNQLSGRWWETWKHPGSHNPDERYLSHDHGPLTEGKGKAQIIRRLRAQHKGRAMLVGDGTSDLEAGATVELFVGFGGVIARERVRAHAEVFIHAPNLAPVLPLALANAPLSPEYQPLYAEGLRLIHEKQVTFQSSGD